MDPTSKTVLHHYRVHQGTDIDGLADLLLNVLFLRNTMSKELICLVDMGGVPWLRLDADGKVSEASKRAIDETFLKLDGKIFFQFVEPMKSRSKSPRRGFSEFVSEMVLFAQRARLLAQIWHEGGERSVELISKEIRKIPGFGGKGFRMKAIPILLLKPTRHRRGQVSGRRGYIE